MKKLLSGVILIISFVLALLFFNLFNFSSVQISVEPVPKLEIADDVIDRLSQAVQFQTVSHEDHQQFDSATFHAFNFFMDSSFQMVDSHLEKTIVNEFSRIYKWIGSDPDLKPVVLLAHLDVVPSAQEEHDQWSYPPFSGAVKEGQVWGRGTIDDKNAVLGIMEAADYLLKENFQPARTIYFCFGHDEEVGGEFGAVAIAEQLKQNGVEAEFVLDEGYAVTTDMIPGIDEDVALIGTAEKGFVTLKLSVNIEGGHSSIPQKETAIDVLSAAISTLKKNSFPPEISDPVKDFMRVAGPEMSFLQKLAFSNPWLFESMIFRIYEAKAPGNALIRTTTAPTIFKAGLKENVVPAQAVAVVNFRTLPGITADLVRERVKSLIDDPRVKLNFGSFLNESPAVSPINSYGYNVINRSIKEVYAGVITAPNLVVGATDARHYAALSTNIYRFAPFRLSPENVSTFHGINERIGIEDYKDGIRFYIQLISNSASDN